MTPTLPRMLLLAAAMLLPAAAPGAAHAADLKILTSGAFKSALLAMVPAIEKDTGTRLIVSNETAGGVALRVKEGAAVDLVILPPTNAASLGPLIGPAQPLAKVGIGVAVKEGAPKPAIATIADIRAIALAARAPAWIDPASGGSSGIYVSKLWESWGIAAQLAPKAVLVHGGLVSDKILDGTADVAFQQLSELSGVPGVAVLGPLPAEIQLYTVYAAAIPAASTQPEAAAKVMEWLTGPQALPVLHAKGMEKP